MFTQSASYEIVLVTRGTEWPCWRGQADTPFAKRSEHRCTAWMRPEEQRNGSALYQHLLKTNGTSPPTTKGGAETNPEVKIEIKC